MSSDQSWGARSASGVKAPDGATGIPWTIAHEEQRSREENASAPAAFAGKARFGIMASDRVAHVHVGYCPSPFVRRTYLAPSPEVLEGAWERNCRRVPG